MLKKSINVVTKVLSHIYFWEKQKLENSNYVLISNAFPGGLDSYCGRSTCLLVGL